MNGRVTDEELDTLERDVRIRAQNIVLCGEMAAAYPLMVSRLAALAIQEALAIVETVREFNLAHRTGGDGDGHR